MDASSDFHKLLREPGAPAPLVSRTWALSYLEKRGWKLKWDVKRVGANPRQIIQFCRTAGSAPGQAHIRSCAIADCYVQRKGPLEFARSESQSSSLAGRLSKVLSYLQDHFSPSHAFHHYLRVAGRSLPHHLGPNGGQIQENHLQRVSVQQQLQELITPHYYHAPYLL